MPHLARTLAILSSLSTAAFAPEPPPPPQVWNAQVAVLATLPVRFPSDDLSAFEALVVEDIKVYRDGTLVHQTRQAWLNELQSYRQRSPDFPKGFSVSRDQYHKLADGGISVREFSYPIAPEGKQIVYHPMNPLRYVTYYVEAGRLARVVYGPNMSSYAGLCQAVERAKAEARPNGTPSRVHLEICD